MKIAVLAVVDHRAVVPRALPQLVEHVEVLVGVLVAQVVRDLALEPEVVGGVRQVRGDDVPADAALGEVVERRHPARERERRLVGGRERHAEAEALGDRGHRRDEQQRVEVRALQSLAQRRLRAAAEHVVRADHVGEEDAVESAVLEDAARARVQ